MDRDNTGGILEKRFLSTSWIFVMFYERREWISLAGADGSGLGCVIGAWAGWEYLFACISDFLFSYELLFSS